jgi:hypothetical protein
VAERRRQRRLRRPSRPAVRQRSRPRARRRRRARAATNARRRAGHRLRGRRAHGRRPPSRADQLGSDRRRRRVPRRVRRCCDAADAPLRGVRSPHAAPVRSSALAEPGSLHGRHRRCLASESGRPSGITCGTSSARSARIRGSRRSRPRTARGCSTTWSSRARARARAAATVSARARAAAASARPGPREGLRPRPLSDRA